MAISFLMKSTSFLKTPTIWTSRSKFINSNKALEDLHYNHQKESKTVSTQKCLKVFLFIFNTCKPDFWTLWQLQGQRKKYNYIVFVRTSPATLQASSFATCRLIITGPCNSKNKSYATRNNIGQEIYHSMHFNRCVNNRHQQKATL